MPQEGRYQDRGKLGQGGMGVVHRAWDAELLRDVAIKVIRADAIIDNDAPDVFPLGDTPVIWSAVDKAGNVARKTQRVRVADTTPPSLEVVLSPPAVWPPNHGLVPVDATMGLVR